MNKILQDDEEDENMDKQSDDGSEEEQTSHHVAFKVPKEESYTKPPSKFNHENSKYNQKQRVLELNKVFSSAVFMNAEVDFKFGTERTPKSIEEEILQSIQNEQQTNIGDEYFEKKWNIKPAWTDPFCDEIDIRLGNGRVLTGSEYEKEIRKAYLELYPTHTTAQWAALDPILLKELKKKNQSEEQEAFDMDEEEENTLIQNTEKVIADKTTLSSHHLTFSRTKNAANSSISTGPIVSIDFHPRSNIFSITEAKKAFLVQIDGQRNSFISCTHLPETAHQAKFISDGLELLVSTDSPSFMVCNLEKSSARVIKNISGSINAKEDKLRNFDVSSDHSLAVFPSTNGYIRLMSQKTKFGVGDLKMNKDVNCAIFSNDCNSVYSSGKGGQVYLWDIKQRRPMHIFQDEGSNNTTCLAVSKDSRYLACGSTSGVVNIYLMENLLQQREAIPKPFSKLENLTTAIDKLQFNADTQILAYGSSLKEASVRLAHIPSFKTYPNFPSMQKYTLSDMSFNCSSGFFCFTSQSNAYLFRIPYYKAL